MIRLDLSAAAPRWVDLGHGVRVHVLPITPEIMMAARRDARLERDEADEAAADDGAAGVRMGRAVARRVLVGWEGVEDERGKPAAVTPENIDRLLDFWWVWESWAARVAGPAMGLVEEKNASAPLPSGSSAGARTTAKTARRPARSARSK